MTRLARRAAAAGVLAAALLMQRPAHAVPVDLELVLAVDVSGSIDLDEARLQRQGYIDAFRDPTVLSAIASGPLGRIAVAYVEWAAGASQSLTVGWLLIDGADGAERMAAALEDTGVYRGRFTSISGAIEFSLPLFEDNGFEGARRVIDVSGDGPNNSGRIVTEARDLAAAAGVTVNGLPIINDRPNPFGVPQMDDLDIYFETCVIVGPGAFVVVAEGFEDFGTAIRRKLILEIAGRVPPRLQSAQGYRPPPCDIGERMMRQYRGRPFFDTF